MGGARGLGQASQPVWKNEGSSGFDSLMRVQRTNKMTTDDSCRKLSKGVMRRTHPCGVCNGATPPPAGGRRRSSLPLRFMSRLLHLFPPASPLFYFLSLARRPACCSTRRDGWRGGILLSLHFLLLASSQKPRSLLPLTCRRQMARHLPPAVNKSRNYPSCPTKGRCGCVRKHAMQ